MGDRGYTVWTMPLLPNPTLTAKLTHLQSRYLAIRSESDQLAAEGRSDHELAEHDATQSVIWQEMWTLTSTLPKSLRAKMRKAFRDGAVL